MQVGFIANLRNERSHVIVEQVTLILTHVMSTTQFIWAHRHKKWLYMLSSLSFIAKRADPAVTKVL